MPAVIVPVGFLMGPEFTADGAPDRPPVHYEVHLGGDPQLLQAIEFAVWAAAFVDPARHRSLTVDRKALEAYLRDDGGEVGRLDDPAPVVAGLLDRGLLVEFDPLTGPLEAVFGRLRLCPQGQGLGSTPDSPDEYRIAIGGNPLASVNATVYRCWSSAHAFGSLWDACRVLPHSDDGLDTESVVREVACVLPYLVSVGLAFLDPAGEV